ncbi:MAG: DUF1232 domain-containing protein [Dehalococcoidia bacterium]
MVALAASSSRSRSCSRRPPPPSNSGDPFARATLAALPQRFTWRQRFEDARAIARDRRVPRLARWLPLALAVYLAFPIDLIPDVIPLLGQLDDVLAVALVLWLLIRLVPHEVIEEHLSSFVGDGQTANR